MSTENYNKFCLDINNLISNKRFTTIEEYKCAIDLIGNHYKDASNHGFKFKTELIFSRPVCNNDSPTFIFQVYNNMIQINMLLYIKYENTENTEKNDDFSLLKLLQQLQQLYVYQTDFIKSIYCFSGYCCIDWIKCLDNVEEVYWTKTCLSYDNQKDVNNQINHPTLRRLIFNYNPPFNIGDVIKHQKLDELNMDVIDLNCIVSFYNQMKHLSTCKESISCLCLNFYDVCALNAFLKYYKQQNDNYCINVCKLEIKIWSLSMQQDNFTGNNLSGLSKIFKASCLYLNFGRMMLPDFQPNTMEDLQEICNELMSFNTVEAPKLKLNFIHTMKPYDLDLLYANRHFFNESSLNTITELMNKKKVK